MYYENNGKYNNDLLQLSFYNQLPEVQRSVHVKNPLILCDATIREGAQGSIIGFTYEEKLAIVRKAYEANVRRFQIGGMANGANAKVITKLVNDIKEFAPDAETEVLSWNTPFNKEKWKKEMDLTLETGVTYLDFLSMLSPYNIPKYGLGLDETETMKRVIDDLGEQIHYFTSRGGKVSFDPMDGPRTREDILFEAYRVAVEAGAEQIRLLDTAGTIGMAGWRYLVSKMRREFPNVCLGVHCHNDFGQAMANVYTSLECGADLVDVCVNGLGERAGNADMAAVAASAHLLYGTETGVDLTKLKELSNFVAEIAVQTPSRNYPIVGAWAFAHGDEQHHKFAHIYPWIFEGMKPELFGNRQEIVLGLQAGVYAMRAKLAELGITDAPDDVAQALVQELKERTVREKRVLNNEDIRSMAEKLLQK